MKKLVKIFAVCASIFLASSIVASCDNAARDAKHCWDSGPVENAIHGGTFKGYVAVYTIDWLDYTKTRSEDTYRVYKKSNGDYVIDYDGDTYILQEADEPFGEGIYALKWKIDYNHYIEDIPTSW